eukprot:TRINITY_DN7885_c0_g1::TRINITY_DN7885_c0_g1_i1::g.23751::m.23751 TRINITY_DN7885_c0_g1::TRINITY_DN7885_c0_g1_i1::g.23751  ORF type:complete len:1216 (-),score=353.74,sp/Q9CXI3/MOXD1_MOUSE/32.74/9e-78,sp/Q9CXI3/MOXD1_MOUSE/33.91/3e-41,sp/Q9CXI3/MOXD1_MOUSE/32.85/2e-12,Cu2_monoox_C/PF03712.10/4e-28,Cu2_monoox_C/PF03712.10/4.2e-34,DOMON/PF03351.12/3.4e-28,DOMON/PF03351.12/1.3e-27,Cu2_monooxygen/PF01082.15/2.3e-26,Cu2_monooxygen/PF01082.15/7.2e-27,SapA/PF02199.10/3.3,SapA/PF02199.10/37 TRINITY_DN7885_
MKGAVLLLLQCLLMTLAPSFGFTFDPSAFDFTQQLNDAMTLYWKYNDTDITFGLDAQTTGWAAIGLSPHSSMIGADIMMGWVKSGVVSMTDRHATAFSTPPVDTENNLYNAQGGEEDGHTYLQWSRPRVTCDAEDMSLVSGTTYRVIFAFNDEDPEDVDSPQYHGENVGAMSISLVDQLLETPAIPDNSTHWDLRVGAEFGGTDFTIPPYPYGGVAGVASFMGTVVADGNLLPGYNQTGKYNYGGLMVDLTVGFGGNEEYPPYDGLGTTYWCKTFQLANDTRRHLTAIETIIPEEFEEIVHHMLLYHCDWDSFVDYDGFCDSVFTHEKVRSCNRMNVIHAWAVGGKTMVYPDIAGYPVGPDGAVYVLMEMHYNNHHTDESFKDTSGLRLHYTDILRQHDIGVLSVGSDTVSIEIPAGEADYKIDTWCPSGCTSLLDDTATVIGILGHGHIHATQVHVRLYRNNTELEPLLSDEYYDFNYQDYHYYSTYREVKPKDIIRTTCHYNTEAETETVFGGQSTQEEMCLAYMVYYPRQALDICWEDSDAAQTSCSDEKTVSIPSDIESKLTAYEDPNACEDVTPSTETETETESESETETTTESADVSIETESSSPYPMESDGNGELFIWDATKYTNSRTLSSKVTLYWDITETTITFGVDGSTTGWVGIGLAPHPTMSGADIYIGWVKDGEVFVTDRYATELSTPPRDASSDVYDVKGMEIDGHTYLEFTRNRYTCDSKDWDVNNGETTHVLWAYNNNDPVDGNADPMQHANRGSMSVALDGGTGAKLDTTGMDYFDLLTGGDDDAVEFSLPPYPQGGNSYYAPAFGMNNEIDMDNYHLQTTYMGADLTVGFGENGMDGPGTTYWCRTFKLKKDKKRHVVKIDTIIPEASAEVVHHILLYACASTNFTEYQGFCYQPTAPETLWGCLGRSPIAGWAVGGGNLTLPENVGIPIGPDDAWTLVMEVHYNNHEEDETHTDAGSGFRLWYTDNLREHDGGIIAVGNDMTSLSIPAGEEDFELPNVCPSQCTSQWDTDLHLFAVMGHAHLTGRKVNVQVFRNGSELQPLLADDYYDFNFQEFHGLTPERVLQPGDSIAVTCNYNTMDRSSVTVGGLATEDEMCLTYFMYYPKQAMGYCLYDSGTGRGKCNQGTESDTEYKVANSFMAQQTPYVAEAVDCEESANSSVTNDDDSGALGLVPNAVRSMGMVAMTVLLVIFHVMYTM